MHFHSSLADARTRAIDRLPPKKGDHAIGNYYKTEELPDPALLIQIVEQDRDAAERLAAELDHLARSAGLDPLETQLIRLAKVTAATYLGKGVVERLAGQIAEREAEVVVFNNPLTPIQQRNLERLLKVKVVDRTGLILEIFANRARTREGRLQVALASLLYQQTRLVRSWTHLERQRGGVGLRGGPGETQIEVDRRLIRNRIHGLKRALVQVERTRDLHRNARRDVPLFTVALVGYTNAGKSTLFNRLAHAEVDAEDKLFATLDPTMRVVPLADGVRAILSDTVGFIRDLPHQLVAAFRSTLEEVREADFLLHVVDLSDPEWREQSKAVHQVLEELDAHQKPTLTLYNKVDLLGGEDAGLVERLDGREEALAISAVAGTGLDELLARLSREVSRGWGWRRLVVPATEGAFLARLCQDGRIIERRDEGEAVHITVALSEIAAGRLRRDLNKFAAPS